MPINQPKNPKAAELAFGRMFQGKAATLVVMQRFAARVCHCVDGAVIKGGLGLEMRLDTPRATKDTDIIISGSFNLGARLERAGAEDLGDFMRFSVEPDKRGSNIEAPGMLYPGIRYTVKARFASGPPPWPGDPFRNFAAEISIRSPAGFDILPSTVPCFPLARSVPIRIYSLPWQLAEKVHAFTDPRHTQTDNPNLMRPRDLLDICRCAVATTPMARVQCEALHAALVQTFERRQAAAAGTGQTLQSLPRHLPTMPVAWKDVFDKAVEQANLPWKTPAAAHELAALFLDPVLNGTARGTWDPARKLWIEEEPLAAESTPDEGGEQTAQQ